MRKLKQCAKECMDDLKEVVAIKFDDNKIRYDLLPLDALTEIAKVLTHGAIKYEERNWEKGFTWGRLIRASMHHLFKFASGEDIDPDSGYSHMAHLGCNVLFLLTHQLRNLGQDNRVKLSQEQLDKMETLLPTQLKTKTSHISFDRVKEIMGKNYIDPENYRTIFGKEIGDIPPLPESITSELLNNPCPLHKDDRKVYETHLLCYVPEKIDEKPLTLNYLRWLSTQAGEAKGLEKIFYDQSWYARQAFANQPLSEGRWVLLAKEVIPDSREKTDAQQLEELIKYPDYQTAKVLELIVPMVMNGLISGERIYFNNSGRCEERPSLDPKKDVVSGARVSAGYFDAHGLGIYKDNGDDSTHDLGRAVVRKLG